MGRKKKTAAVEQTPAESKPINQDIKASGTQNLNYQGTIKLSIQRGNKTLKSKTYHNSGMPNLFKFLANCLAGLRAEELRPVKIKLFRYPAADMADPVTPPEFSWSRAWSSLDSKPVQVSSFVVYDAAPIVAMKINEDAAEDENNGADPNLDNYHYETTLHFRVPFSYISDNTIHMIGLYANGVVDNSDVSAYYLLTNDSGTEWEPLELDDEVGNFSIVVEWTLEISNNTGTTTAQSAS